MSQNKIGYGRLAGKTLSDEIDGLVKKRAEEIIQNENRKKVAVDYHTKIEGEVFNIQSHATAESRTFFKMTDEERALRKQWVIDQRLGPNEPRDNPELLAAAYPKNMFRRSWHYPFNQIGALVEKSLACYFSLF